MTIRNQAPATTPFVSVIVLGWGGEEFVSKCLTALSHQTYPHYEIIVVDNASPDRTANIVERDFPNVRLIRTEENLGVAGGNNVGLRAAGGEILILTNVDTAAQPEWIERLVEPFSGDPTIGIAGSRLLYPDGTVQYGGGQLDPIQGIALHYAAQDGVQTDDVGVVDTDFATGASLAIRREVLDQIGLEDEGYFPIDYEDPDICYRARLAGWRVCYVPAAVSVHYESSTFKPSPRRALYLQAGRIRFVCKFWTDEQLRGPFLIKESEDLRSVRLHPTTMSPVYFKTLLDVDDLADWRARCGVSDRDMSRRTLTEVLDHLRMTCTMRSASPLPEVPSGTLEAIANMLQQWLTGEVSSGGIDDPLVLELLLSLSSTPRQISSHLPIAWPHWPPGLWPKIEAGLQKVTRRLLRWYINPIVQQQNQVNAGLLQSVTSLFLLHRRWASKERALQAEIDSLKRELDPSAEMQDAGQP